MSVNINLQKDSIWILHVLHVEINGADARFHTEACVSLADVAVFSASIYEYMNT